MSRSQASDLERVVVCSILERDATRARRALLDAPRDCALVEVRADHLRASELTELIGTSDRELVVTVRPRSHGGGYEGSEQERRLCLEQALAAGAALIDVEWGSAAAELARGAQAGRVILSHHAEDCREEELRSVYAAMAATRARRLKIVPRASKLVQARVVRDLLALARGDGRSLVCFAAGRAGAVTRLLAPAWGSWATYGAIRAGRETAEGQFTAADLLETYDVLGIGPQTRRFGLIGSQVFRSPSPAMHRAAYLERGIDARYLPLELDEAGEFLPLAGSEKMLGIEGFGVTMPFKEVVARHCSLDDPTSASSGAVNTVCVERAALRGYNTDGPAALELISTRLDPREAAVALLGAGGTARAIAAALRAAGASVTLFCRAPERGERAARELGVACRPLGELERSNWSVLINATPLGSGDPPFLADSSLRGELVLDAVYGSETTPLIAAARRQGLTAVDGFQLLTAQAVLQFERLTGSAADAASMAAAGKQWLSRARA